GFGTRLHVTSQGMLLHHALLWHGSAASAVDLNPAGFESSHALAAWGDQQGGWAGDITNSKYAGHAALWSGSARSFIDLNPSADAAGAVSVISGMNDGIQVGFAANPRTDFEIHATAWF